MSFIVGLHHFKFHIFHSRCNDYLSANKNPFLGLLEKQAVWLQRRDFVVLGKKSASPDFFPFIVLREPI